MITPRSTPSPEEVASHYDDLDTFYRDVWGEHVHHGYWVEGRETPNDAVIALLDLVADNAVIRGGERICDVGCGYGATAAYLANHHAVTVKGITLSAAQYRYAIENHANDQCTFVLGDWLANDFPSESYDVLTAIECLAHMTDKARFFDEAYRVLVTGGRLVACSWLAGPDASARQVRWLLEPICAEGRLPSLPDATDVRQLAEGAGFVDISMYFLTERVKRTWAICARRVLRGLLTDSRYRQYLLTRRSGNRGFLKTVGRIMIAYRTGAMEYGLFVARKRT